MTIRAFFLTIVFGSSSFWHFAEATDASSRINTNDHQQYFSPKALTVGHGILWPTSKPSKFALTLKSPIATIDYGSEVAGYPFFEIESVEAPAQIEVKYSEPYHGLHHVWGDGPYTFSTGLSNAVRVETFNITKAGTVKSSLIQGGQRWQSIQLVAGNKVTISHVGFEPTVSVTNPDTLPARFSSDDTVFNAIWKLGQKAATMACLEKGTQKAVWDIDPVKGAFVHSVRSSPNVETTTLENYTLQFETSIERAGLWWSVAQPVGVGNAIQLLLVGELPETSTFANTNRSLTPPNSILLAYGYGFVNQTTLESYLLDTFTIPFNVHEKEWYTVTTVLSGDDHLAVQLNGISIFNVSLSDYYTGGSQVSLSGSFGLGAYQDQAAWVRNVKVHDSANGSLLYVDSLRDKSALVRYGTQANLGTVCLDGPKRDRLVWLGDFYHTSRIIGASTDRFDWSRGTLSFLLDTQVSNGQLCIAPAMGYNPSTTIDAFSPNGAYHGLEDYQILGFLGFYHLIKQTNDLKYAAQTWPQWQKQLAWLLSTINATDGLVDVYSAFLGSAQGGSAVSCLTVEALNGASEIASVLGNQTAARTYKESAEKLADAVNTHLWNDELGVYSLSRSNKSDFSVAGIGLCITSGVANSTRASQAVSSQNLSQLKLGPGYKDDTTVNEAASSVSISPNTNGFLLPALFMGNATTAAKELLRSMWGAMLSEGVETGIGNDTTATGASWEYLDVDGAPGLSLFTSLSHPWGGAATYVLTEWAAGLRPADGPKGFGYKNWLLAPETGLQMGLKKASARVVTEGGATLFVAWEVDGSMLDVKIDAPHGTTGRIQIGSRYERVSGGGIQSVRIPR
ncbi:uncharacterized protein N7484_011783 [Penicillium longicatenatum]|uniref:uncharacterized protein n=1 Tax=Penicillium longicatenatum TaxID=1561947 RepID=UPI002548AEFD|nr:uncharacterized protein N7484_011783 [Penicillium longicatenatum]KAJ5631683.1 hypothetical protein N7484_011783 [Penicillium longicatenatum]